MLLHEKNIPRWTKGTLVRDKIPMCKSTKFSTNASSLTIKNESALKQAILKQKMKEFKQKQEEEASRAKEEESQGSETSKYNEKISELEKKLEELQKEKHNLFLSLKKVLQQEKKRQTLTQSVPEQK